MIIHGVCNSYGAVSLSRDIRWALKQSYQWNHFAKTLWKTRWLDYFPSLFYSNFLRVFFVVKELLFLKPTVTWYVFVMVVFFVVTYPKNALFFCVWVGCVEFGSVPLLRLFGDFALVARMKLTSGVAQSTSDSHRTCLLQCIFFESMKLQQISIVC